MNVATKFVLLFLLTSSLCMGQDSVSRRKVVAAADSPITMSEASDAFSRLDRVLARVVRVTITLPKFPTGDAPLKRSDVIARLDRLFETCKPQFKFTPRKVSYDPKILALPSGHPQRASLEKLIRWGCIGRTAALATGKGESLTATDFGDAIGLFILRIADVTHRPDPKFTPIIGGGMGG